MLRTTCALVIAAVAAACGGSASNDTPTTPPPAEPAVAAPVADAGPAEPAERVDYDEIDLPSASNFLPLLKVGATGIGCSLVAEQEGGLAYQCEEGLIFMVQKGAKLRYACENAPADQCGALMQRITAKMLEAAGG